MSPDRIHFGRDTHFFVDHAARSEELREKRHVMPLAADQLLHPLVPRYYVVRMGKLRVSQFLDDGREVVRAVLQAGAVFHTLPADDSPAPARTAVGDIPAADIYSLSTIVIMALGETELWAFAEDPRG